MTHPRLFHVTAVMPRSSMEVFLRRRAASDDAGQFAAHTRGGSVAVKHRANQSAAARKDGHLTAAHKKDTGAETYGEPQTPADHGSLAQALENGR